MQIIIINGEDEFLKECAALEEAKSSLSNAIEIHKSVKSFTDAISFDNGTNTTYVVFNVEDVPTVPDVDGMCIFVSKVKKELSHHNAKHVLSIPSLKSYDNNNEVVPWILKEGHRRNIDLTSYASAFFVNNGNRLRKIYSEIGKVHDALRSGEKDPTSLRSLFVRSAEITPKDVVLAITNGNARAALTYYDALQDLKDETGWILSYLMRHCLNYLTIIGMKNAGKTIQDISAATGIHPYVLTNQYYPNLNAWSSESMKSSLKLLGELDVLNKSGKRAVEFDLEEEIIRLAQEAFNAKRSNREKTR